LRVKHAKLVFRSKVAGFCAAEVVKCSVIAVRPVLGGVQKSALIAKTRWRAKLAFARRGAFLPGRAGFLHGHFCAAARKIIAPWLDRGGCLFIYSELSKNGRGAA
jgi:hypothetical protein